MPKLVITDSDGTREVGLSSGDTLGRTSQCAIKLEVPEVSRQHCRFSFEQGSWFVEDLKSSNGTTVNGRKVTKFELADGDVVGIGKATLRFLDVEVQEEEDEISLEEDEISLETRVFLIFSGGGLEGEARDLPQGRVSVGRHAKHPLRLRDASVSGDHAVLVRDGDDVTVQDAGSSNGTFINGRKVTEAGLESGDRITFGRIDAVFGIGDPKDFQAPVAGAAMDASEVDAADDAFELDLDRVPAKKDTVWNLVALVMILALGGGAFVVLTHESVGGGSGPLSLDRGSNLLPARAWSFEAGPEGAEGELLWLPDADAPGLAIDTLGGGGRSGEALAELVRAEALPDPSLALLRDEAGTEVVMSVSGGQAYQLGAHFQAGGGTPVAVVSVSWLTLERGGSDTLVEMTRDHVLGGLEGDGWQEVRDTVVAPTGATSARVRVGLLGAGDCLVDDVRFQLADSDGGRAVEIAGTQLAVSPTGTLRASRYGNLVIDGLGLRFGSGDGQRDQITSFLPTGPLPGGVGGRIEGAGDLRAKLEAAQAQVRWHLEGAAVAAASGLVLPVASNESSVITVRGEGATRHGGEFEATEIDALIVGEGGNRLRLHLVGAGGDRLPMTVRSQKRGAGREIVLGTSSQSRLTVVVDLDFSSEAEAARALMGEARQAERKGQFGEAMQKAEEIVARYPFEERTEAAAQELLGRLGGQGRAAIESFEQRLEDAVFFRALSEQEAFLTELQAAASAWQGTSVGTRVESLAATLAEQVSAFQSPRRAEAAARLLARALDYDTSKKPALARLFLSTVVRNFADTDEAAQAKAMLERLGSEER